MNDFADEYAARERLVEKVRRLPFSDSSSFLFAHQILLVFFLFFALFFSLLVKHFELASVFAARSGFSSAKDVCAIWVNHAAQIAFIAYLMEHDLRSLCVSTSDLCCFLNAAAPALPFASLHHTCRAASCQVQAADR